ncbi:MAG TPA: hypothetical protein VFF40_09045 [Acidimicrobiia bacterium]|nr:hypothetical protein [Acidimicrobiia bacterium]
MAWTVVKFAVALVAAFGIYSLCTRLLVSFTRVPPEEPEPGDLQPVDLRYRCIVCWAELTMTAAPGGEEPEAPRHCREDMLLIADASST